VLKAIRSAFAGWRAQSAAAPADFAGRLAEARDLQNRGEPAAAAAIYDAILAADAAQLDALVQSGAMEGHRGNLQVARARLEAALRINPNLAEAQLYFGNVLNLLGDAPGAVECYEIALALDPTLALAWNNLGLAHFAAGAYQQAATEFASALANEPGFDEALRNLVNAKGRLGLYEDLRQPLEAVLARDPGNAEAHAALGFVELKGLGAPERALVHFDRALELGLGHTEFLVNRGIALHDLGRIDEALASHDAALALDPAQPHARFHRALALLIQYRFDIAWDDYESRQASQVLVPRQVDLPPWDGRDFTGKTVLILAEQGIGDEIMFASCFGDAIARAKHCIIDCSAKLEPIFRRSFPQATVHGGTQFDDAGWLAGLPRPDLQIQAGSLPRLFRHNLAAFPQHDGYLLADAQKIAYWRTRLAGLGSGLKVGVSWRGGTAGSRTGMRSLALDMLAPLFSVPGAHFVSLQYDARNAEVAGYCARTGNTLVHFDEAIADYDETAALVSALNLVISVCTAVIHLGGALGTPVWVLAPMVPEWRYGIRGEVMPWYPKNRVLRQTVAGEWDSVIARAAGELYAIAADPDSRAAGEPV
jgi:tetratricopeptide (TPR) repeat protein